MMANRAVRSTAGGAAVACALVALVGPVAGPARANSALPGLENAASVPTDTTGAAEAEPTLRELADRAAKTAQQAVAVQDLRSRQLAASIAKELTAQAQLRAASQTRLVAAAAQVVAARAQSVAVGEQRRTLAVHQWAVTNRNAQAAAVATLRRQAQVAVADPGTSAALLLRVRNRSGLLKLWAARALATRGAYLRAEDVAIRANTKLAGAQLGLIGARRREDAALAFARVAHQERLDAARDRDAAAAVAAAAVAAARRAAQAAQSAPRVGSGAVFEAVSTAWSSMTWTLYDHHNRVDEPAGRYQFDCVGMTNYFLTRAAPEANAELRRVEGIPVGRVPKPDKVVDFIRRIPVQGTPRWQVIRTTPDIRAGDLLAFGSKGLDVGHAAIAAGAPTRLPDGTYSLVIYDSTGLTHGPGDSRLTDPRAQPGAIHPHTGLGRGRIRLAGAGPTNWQVLWDLTRTRPYGAAVAIARPLR